MILQLFRDHLATELDNLPDMQSREIQSYALTTAVLTRRILDSLDIKDLTIPSEFYSRGSAYNLRKVVDRIIHYRVLHKDGRTFGLDRWGGVKADIVTLCLG